MPYRAHFRSLAVVMVFALFVALPFFIPNASANGGDDQAVVPEKTQLTYPNLGSELDQLATSGQAIAGSNKHSAGGGLISQAGSIAVTIYLLANVNEVVAFLNDNGGDPRNVGEDYIEAYVPISLLGLLSEQPGVLRVRKIIPPQPTQLAQQVLGNGPEAHGSMPWNQAGYTGQGVKVGIIDDFYLFSSLRGTEVPSSVVVRCYTDIGVYTTNLADCDQEPEAVSPWPECSDAYQRRAQRGASHGTIVAESLLDIAPEVTLYLANPPTRGDMQEAVDWMATQGVQVINYSAGWIYDGPGDGTSPLSVSPLNTVDRAVASDVLWVNSAGNAAQDTWFGSYSDPDGNGIISFGGSNDEVLDTPWDACSTFTVQLRWDDDWTGASTDLDLHIYSKSAGGVLFSSDDEQSGESGQVPWEAIGLRTRVDTDDFGIVVSHKGGDVPDWIQIVAWTPNSIQHHTLSGSITNPAESANPGLLAVGAAPWFDVNTIEFFSSQGPTPDGRTKPEIVGADCGETALTPLEFSSRLGGNCGFAGTSQSSPHVAGMAALVRQRFPELTAEQVAAYFKNSAEARGTVPNNTWGYGFAKLSATDVGGCVHELTSDGTTPGQWSPHCQSLELNRGYSQFYTFTLEETTQVTIDLTSSVDPYLFLRAGEARSGDPLYKNDDVDRPGGDYDSRISVTLAAGAYTIETTTYAADKTGAFTLTITGLSGSTTDPDPDPDPDPGTDTCAAVAITADGTTPGTWTSDCPSHQREGRYARYYTFILTQDSAVTIDLESSVDPYLFLRAGEARSGDFLYRNDDIVYSENRDSRIVATLQAGGYTIEATTYAAAKTGAFTLTINGLSGTATDQDSGPDPETDICNSTNITANGATLGEWTPDCRSDQREGRYARYYTFTLAQVSAVTIDLESNEDTYLYLRQGEVTTGAFLQENDDVDRPGRDYDSRISVTLAADAYTIEATTYAAAKTGAFTLTITGLSGTATDQDPGPDPETDTCGDTITANGATLGEWTSDCRSDQREGRYARYYTFTLEETTQVTIDLESSVDPYLYLRQGEAATGAFLHENDDVDRDGRDYDSRIVATLAAGTYTIEATTYHVAQAGSFTLTVPGLY